MECPNSKPREGSYSASPHATPYQIKLYYVSGTKIFVKKVYRNIQTFAFNVLKECSSGASRNGAVQIFFLTPDRSVFTDL